MALSWLLEAGDGEQITFFEENETPAILTGTWGARSHICVEFAVTPGVAGESAPLWTCPLHTRQGGFGVVLLMKNQDLDFISSSNHMQYLEGVSGE